MNQKPTPPPNRSYRVGEFGNPPPKPADPKAWIVCGWCFRESCHCQKFARVAMVAIVFAIIVTVVLFAWNPANAAPRHRWPASFQRWAPHQPSYDYGRIAGALQQTVDTQTRPPFVDVAPLTTEQEAANPHKRAIILVPWSVLSIEEQRKLGAEERLWPIVSSEPGYTIRLRPDGSERIMIGNVRTNPSRIIRNTPREEWIDTQRGLEVRVPSMSGGAEKSISYSRRGFFGRRR